MESVYIFMSYKSIGAIILALAALVLVIGAVFVGGCVRSTNSHLHQWRQPHLRQLRWLLHPRLRPQL